LQKGCLTISTSTDKKGNTVNKVDNAIPGVFFYYGDYTATGNSQITIHVKQSNTRGWKPFDAQNTSNVRLFVDQCQTVSNATYNINANTGTASITFTPVAGKKYVISVKYDMKSIIGETFGGSAPALNALVNNYTFAMYLGNSSTAINNSTGELPLYNGCSDNTPKPDGTCPVNTSITSSIVATTPGQLDASASKIAVAASPNPFKDRVKFVITSPISGRGSLEVYNLLGQKVNTVFQGNVDAGISKTVEYTVPIAHRTSLMYIFRVGNLTSSGKLLH
jgi:hypothetical protein